MHALWYIKVIKDSTLKFCGIPTVIGIDMKQLLLHLKRNTYSLNKHLLAECDWQCISSDRHGC